MLEMNKMFVLASIELLIVAGFFFVLALVKQDTDYAAFIYNILTFFAVLSFVAYGIVIFVYRRCCGQRRPFEELEEESPSGQKDNVEMIV